MNHGADSPFSQSTTADALRAEIEEKILVGIEQLERGECREMTAADWVRLRQECLDRLRNKT